MPSFLDSWSQPLIIAEIGAKYAEMPVIKQMILGAKEAGVDLVKFQTFCAGTIAAPGAMFVMDNGDEVSQFEYFRSYELTEADHREIDTYCQSIGIGWISTPSHPDDITLLETFDPPAYKTGSDDLTNLQLLRRIARTGKPIIVSTGMSTLDEVANAVDTIRGVGNNEIVLLHCVVSYPSRAEDANLRAITTMRDAFGLSVGLSDHTTDEFTSVVATTLGATVIEKHLTLDHALKLPDNEASLDPAAFKRLVERVKMVKASLGDGKKSFTEKERQWRQVARKSLFASRDLRAGEQLTEDSIAIRRPGNGISPLQLDSIIGRTLTRDVPAGAPLALDMF